MSGYKRGMDIPEMRTGKSSKPRKDDKPYSPASYCAQYGIFMDEAEELVDMYQTHSEIDLEIGLRMARNPEMFKRAMEF